MKKQLIMGIDHGNSQIKTAHCCFTASVREYTMGNEMQPEILELHGKQYYQTTTLDTTEVNKTATNRYYLLTLFAIGRELESRNLPNTDTYHLHVGIGFPPGFYDAEENKKFINYLIREKDLKFSYNSKSYHIIFEKFYPLIQGVSALYSLNPQMQSILKSKEFACIDIGGWTVDFIAVDKFFKAKLDRISSMSEGSVNYTSDLIRNKVMKKYKYEITYENIVSILNGEGEFFESDTKRIVKTAFKEAANKIIIKTQTIGIDLRHQPVFLTGGGAKYLRKYFEESNDVAQVYYVDNINANAIGYEKIVNVALRF